LSPSSHDGDRPPAVPIPYGDLSEDALRGVVESFVLREGTDYGEREVSFESKVSQVIARLARGEAQIMFDPATETVAIIERSGGQP
jgi:uncharacterized protein YheU (UPF0270 family)